MNEYDTELVKSILASCGYIFTDKEELANIVLLNTCSVRENAHRKVYGHIHEIHHRRRDSPVIIGVLGCMATGLKEELLNDKNLNIDFIAGPDSYKQLPKLIQKAFTKSKSFDITLSEVETYADIDPTREKGVNAWIAIMRGCNNFCTFCIVPYTRGRERSRSVQSILDEVKRLVDQGYSQLTLLGQNVNSYKYDGVAFPDLLESVSKVDGIRRIRFTSPHPKDFPEGLHQLIAENPKICKQIHLPLQSGNDRILKMMNRPYSKQEFLNLVDKLKSACPAIAISTDIIVGFPTETHDEFQDTVDVTKHVQFDSAFIFKYSPRKGTVASKKYDDCVAEEEKTQRIVALNALQKEISLKKNEAHVGKTLEVIVENVTADSIRGRSDGNKLVILPKYSYTMGDYLNTKIISASPHALRGEVL